MKEILTDVTERKLAKAGLRILATAIEVKEDILVGGGKHKKSSSALNKALTYITGYSAEEVVGCKPAPSSVQVGMTWNSIELNPHQ